MDLGIEEVDVCTYYTAHSWVCELFPMIGIFRASGPMDTAKTRLTKKVLMPLQYKAYSLVGSLTEAAFRREMISKHKEGLRTLVCDDVGWDTESRTERSDLLINRCDKGGKASYLEPDGDGGWYSVTQEIYGPTLLGCRLTFSDVAIESRCLDVSMGTQHRTGRSLPPGWDGGENAILTSLEDFRKEAMNSLKPVKPQTPRGVDDRVWDIGWPMVFLAELVGDADGVKHILNYLRRRSEDLVGEKAQEPAMLVLAAIIALAAESDFQSNMTLPPIPKPIAFSEIREQIWAANRVALVDTQIGRILRQFGFKNGVNIYQSGGYTKLRGIDWRIVKAQAAKFGLTDELLDRVQSSMFGME